MHASRKIKVCILYALAGGGHLSVANALKESFFKVYDIQADTYNLIKDFGPVGLKEPEKIYRFMLKYLPTSHELMVKSSSNSYIHKSLVETFTLLTNDKLKKWVGENPYDIYITTYPLYVPLLEKMEKSWGLNTKKTITVVTDIAYMLKMWFSKNVDLTILPSLDAYGYGFKYFKEYSNRVEVLGLPIQQKWFNEYDTLKLFNSLELDENKKTILIFGGGEGMIKMISIVKAIDKVNRGITILVACGKDNDLKRRLEKGKYLNIVKIIGWTDEFYKYLLVSDLVITKAGPTTITECLTMNKQMIIFDFIKGQEEGNINYAINQGIAVFIKNPKEIAQRVKEYTIKRKKVIMPLKANYSDLVVKRCIKLYEKGNQFN